MSLIRHCAFFLLVLLLASANTVCADEEPTLRTIIDAWRTREKVIQSYDFHWVSKEFMAAEKEAPKMPDGTVYKKRPASTYFWHFHLAVDADGNGRFDDSGRGWDMLKGDFAPTSGIMVYKDNNERMIVPDKGDHDYQTVVVNRVRPLKLVPAARPLNMAFRPLTESAGGFDVNTVKLTEETDTIDNVPLLILTDAHNKIWVDPSKEFLPVKCVESGEHVVGFPHMTEITIAYTHDSTHGWLPKSWTSDSDHGNFTESATVTDFTVNQPIPASEFEIAFPGGAMIHDFKDHSLSVLYPDGKKHLLKPGEFTGNNFQDLLKSEVDSK